MNITSNKKIIMNSHISYGGIGKRFLAILIDLILLLAVGIAVVYLVQPQIAKNFEFAEAYAEFEEQNDILRDEMKISYLFLTDKELLSDGSNASEIELADEPMKEEKYAEATYKFYRFFLFSEEGGEKYDETWYLENVLKTGTATSLFVLSANPVAPALSVPEGEVVDLFLPNGVQYKSTTSVTDLKAFNKTIYEEAAKVFMARPKYMLTLEKYNEVERLSNLITFISVLIALTLGSTIFFLMIPLLLKNGKTIGKLVFKLGITTKYGYKISSLGIVIRYFGFLSIEILLNLLLTYFGLILVVPLISFTFVVFTATRRSLHDYVAGTVVVDERSSLIYKNIAEYERALLEEQKFTSKRGGNVNEELFSERFGEGSGA